jgi:hypothetical protein
LPACPQAGVAYLTNSAEQLRRQKEKMSLQITEISPCNPSNISSGLTNNFLEI